MSARMCAICERREITSGYVCDGCHDALLVRLASIEQLWRQLTEPHDPMPDRSGKRVRDDAGRPLRAGTFHPPRPSWLPARSLPSRKPELLQHHDPIAGRLPAALVAGETGTPRVGGSREAPLPLPVDVLDLTLPRPERPQGSIRDTLVPATVVLELTARHDFIRHISGEPEYVSVHVRGKARQILRGHDGRVLYALAGDQIGQQSAAAVLDSWIREWRDVRGQREHLPPATARSMLSWLAYRVAWACEHYGWIADFASEMRQLQRALRSACGETDPKPQVCEGVPCKRCDLVNVLYRTTDGSGFVECGNCARLLTTDEYHDWVRLVAAGAKVAA